MTRWGNDRPGRRLSPLGEAVSDIFAEHAGDLPEVINLRYTGEELEVLGRGYYRKGARKVFKEALSNLRTQEVHIRPLQEELSTAEATEFGTPKASIKPS